MLVAVKYLGRVGFGATAPQLFLADDGTAYVVKLQSNPLGPRVLANELLAAKFGEWMKLRFPGSDIIKLGDTIIIKNRRLIAAGAKPGLHFASRYLNHVTYAGMFNLAKAANKEEMAGIILFDHIFHNVDRTRNWRNVLMRRENGRYMLYGIDHSHLFGRGKWNIDHLAKQVEKIQINQRSIYGLLLKHFLNASDFTPYLIRVQELSDRQIELFIQEIPREWLPIDAERQALCAFVKKRRDLARDIVERICALIPNVHGRADMNKGK